MPHGRRRQRFWFRRSARLRRCGGRGDLVGQDDDAAAGDACADAACADARLAMLPRPHLRLSRPKPWGPTGRLGPASSPTHDARSVGAVKAYPSSVSVTVVCAVRSLADSTLLSYAFCEQRFRLRPKLCNGPRYLRYLIVKTFAGLTRDGVAIER